MHSMGLSNFRRCLQSERTFCNDRQWFKVGFTAFEESTVDTILEPSNGLESALTVVPSISRLGRAETGSNFIKSRLSVVYAL